MDPEPLSGSVGLDDELDVAIDTLLGAIERYQEAEMAVLLARLTPDEEFERELDAAIAAAPDPEDLRRQLERARARARSWAVAVGGRAPLLPAVLLSRARGARARSSRRVRVSTSRRGPPSDDDSPPPRPPVLTGGLLAVPRRTS